MISSSVSRPVTTCIKTYDCITISIFMNILILHREQLAVNILFSHFCIVPRKSSTSKELNCFWVSLFLLNMLMFLWCSCTHHPKEGVLWNKKYPFWYVTCACLDWQRKQIHRNFWWELTLGKLQCPCLNMILNENIMITRHRSKHIEHVTYLFPKQL